MFHKILVPLDGSALAECVLPHTVAMAKITGATVTLLRVVERSHEFDQSQTIDPLNWHLHKAEAQAYVDGIRERLQAVGLTAETLLLEGRAAERVIDFAHEHKHDLIILSSHGQSGLSGWNVSSVVQKIILRAYTSIMIVRAYLPDANDLTSVHYGRILAPLDGSQRAEYVLPALTTLAQGQQAQSLLIHVVGRPEMPRRVPLTTEEIELADKLVERNYEEATRYLAQLESRLPGEVQAQVIISDYTIGALHDLVDDNGIDLVLLSAHGYSGQNKRPYGSVVTSFIVYGTTPLLIVQDLKQGAIGSTQAEMMASHMGNGVGMRTTIHAKPAF